MTSTIKVNNIQNQCGANIINENANTITIGASGDTIALASGASQTGFGREGSVDWQTGSIKTATFTAANGEGYFCNTTSSAFTVNLPSSPSAGNIVAVSDYAKTFATNNLTIGRGGSNIEGSASDLVLDATGLAMTFVYVDATKGWKVVGAGREADKTAAEFIEATGGTITTVCTNFKVHTFTGPGTFCVSNAGNSAGSNTVDYLVVAGGGGGSASHPTSSGAGGAGAGGFRESPGTTTCYTASPLGTSPAVALPVTAQGYPITVGGGGAAGVTAAPVPNPATHGANGSNSVFSTITSTGGGRSGAGDCAPAPPGGPSGQPGGSGGGTSNYSGSPGATIGAGNTPPVSPPQGNPGGLNGSAGGTYPTGGGGGATAAAVDASPFPNSCTSKSDGGAGATTNISGSPVAYAGGGGGALYSTPAQSSGGTGGGGGGGNAPAPNERPGQAGTTNRGGGGGGGVHGKAGGAGGSGIVIIRYKFQ